MRIRHRAKIQADTEDRKRESEEEKSRNINKKIAKRDQKEVNKKKVNKKNKSY